MASRRRLVAIGALVAVSCTSPAPVPAPTPTVSGSEERVAAQPGREELLAALTDLRQALVTARTELQGAIASSGSVAERAAAEYTVHILIADPRFAGDLDGDGAVVPPPVDPVLPSAAENDPDTAQNLLFPAVAAAHEAATAEGGVIAVLTEAVTGDVTSWQRHPEGPIEAVEVAVDEGTEEAVNALDGGAVRALAWSLLALGTEDDTQVHEFAVRAEANLSVAITAVDNLLDEI